MKSSPTLKGEGVSDLFELLYPKLVLLGFECVLPEVEFVLLKLEVEFFLLELILVGFVLTSLACSLTSSFPSSCCWVRKSNGFCLD